MNAKKWLAVLLVVLTALCLAGCRKEAASGENAAAPEPTKSLAMLYEEAQALLAQNLFTEAAKAFDALGSYEDAARLAMYCKAAEAGENGDYETAVSVFRLLDGLKESGLMASYYQARAEESAAAAAPGAWEHWPRAASMYDALPLFRDTADRAEACRNAAFVYAESLAAAADYSTAVTVLSRLGGYRDSAMLSRYYEAFRIEQEGRYTDASAAFAELGDFRDAAIQVAGVLQRGYDAASALETAGDREGAYVLFLSLEGYSDSYERACRPWYLLGESLRAEGEWEDAVRAFEKALEYSDAVQQTLITWYQYGEACMDAGDENNARYCFMRAKDYADARERYAAFRAAYDMKIAAGRHHTAGLRADGTVIACGENRSSQCSTWLWKDIVAVTAYRDETLGLRGDGSVVTAGRALGNELGTGEWKDIAAAAAGRDHAAALKKDGTVISAGENYRDQCDTDSWTEITALDAGETYTLGLRKDGTVLTAGQICNIPSGTDEWRGIAAVAAGTYHAIGLRNDGTVVTAGAGDSGQRDTDGWTGIIAVAAGEEHTVGLRRDGTVVAVGSNGDGQCDTDGWTDIVAIAAGAWHTVGLRKDGSVVTAGSEENGRRNTGTWNLLDSGKDQSERPLLRYGVIVTPSGGRSKEVNVHVYADKSAKNITRVKDGEYVLVVRQSGQWSELLCNDLEGYIMSEYVRVLTKEENEDYIRRSGVPAY